MGSSDQWPSIANVDNPIAEMVTRRPTFRFERYYPGADEVKRRIRLEAISADTSVFVTACWRMGGRDFRVTRPATAKNVNTVKEDLARECLQMIEVGNG